MNTGHLSVYLVVFRLVLEDVDEGEDEDGRHVNRERDEEHEKITVVATTDAVVHPGAVMIKNLNAVVANTTVTTSRRSVELTRNTPFHTNLK